VSQAKSQKVVVVGGGYVGLPLAVEAGLSGFRTAVLDIDEERVEALRMGRSYIPDVSDARLQKSGLSATRDPAVCADADVVVICVPTPLRKTRDPDVSYILSAAEAVARQLLNDAGPPRLVILESTTYPGFTREVLVPLLEEHSGLKAGTLELAVAFSPERVDPGNKTFETRNTPKVVGGLTPDCCARAAAFYKRVVAAPIVEVSSCDTAEVVKLHENTFRSVNIGLANELSMMCSKLGVDTHEVINAAASKPFGFMPFYPGPGVGGHCIGPDPLYLSWKLKSWNYRARFIELADEINTRMPHHVVNMVHRALNSIGRCVSGSNIAVLGVAYKANVGDTRESPALLVIDELLALGARLVYRDSHVPTLELPSGVRLTAETKCLPAHCAVILAAHADTPSQGLLLEQAQVIVDARGYMHGCTGAKIYRL